MKSLGAALVVVAAIAAGTGCGGPPGATKPGTRGQGGAAGAGGSGPIDGGGGAPDGGGGAAIPWVWSVRCPDGHDPTDPIDYGRCAVDQAAAEAAAKGTISIASIDDPSVATVRDAIAPVLDARAESFVIAPIGGATWIVGRDAIGAMYGALEIAERLRLDGAGAVPPSDVSRGAPTVGFRGANLFWVLPEADETSWWFLDEGFWTGYLDLMAHARLDVLDIHGMYDLSSTLFPNALLYLAQSATFPEVGAPASDRARNLTMFNRVIAMAKARGIRVGLMTYQASSDLTGSSNEVLSDADLKTYVRESAADLAYRAPGLAMMGFRIGESLEGTTWYSDTFVAGVQSVAPAMTISTRTWGAGKSDILTLASSIGPNMVLEAKYNGEHLGPPYAVAGGAMAKASSYSYQNYLEPPRPWSFVFQVRAGGTHQIFRQASYARTQRAIQSLALSPAVAGFTLEPPTAYTPQRDFYHAQTGDQFYPWAYARDDLMYLEWGRLGYDPTEPEAHFRAILAREAGTDTLWPAVQAASDIVPWILTGRTCGFDSRSFEPEMELGGDVGQWADLAGGPDSVSSCKGAAPFDTFAVASPAEAAADLLAGTATARLPPSDVAALVLGDADTAAQTVSGWYAPNTLARDISRECVAVADLGRYFGHKLRAATALAVFAGSGAANWMDAARAEATPADDAWQALVTDTGYIKPFDERLRMEPLGYDPFHWSKEVSGLGADGTALDDAAGAVASAPPSFAGTLPDPEIWLAASRGPAPTLTALTVDPADATAPSWTVRTRFAAPLDANATVAVLWKPFDSETDWTAVPAGADTDGTFVATIAGGGAGAMFAVEVRTANGAWRLPDPIAAMPYIPLAP
ncbi:MAG TPA: hypothetical protein VGP64_09525 [Polyangia bacterium]|jgi:hypothetical protein